MVCSKCGKEIIGGYEFCMACGEKIDHEAVQKEVGKIKKKKIIIISIIAVIIVVVGILAFAINNYNISRNGLYKNIAWGASMKDINKIIENDEDIGERLYGSDIYELKKFLGADIENGRLTFDLDERGKLNEVTVYYDIKNGNKDIEVCDKKLTKLYGKPEYEIGEGERLFKEQFVKLWETKEGYVCLSNIVGNTMVFINYTKDNPYSASNLLN